MAHFQVKLGGEWKDYSSTEDKILKRAFMAGFPNVRYSLRGQEYTYDFKHMVQINGDTQKQRLIRAPCKWKPPAKPLCPAGPTTVVNVPAGSPGKTIQVPHPRCKGQSIAVQVPKSARPGQAMLVPLPPKVVQSPPAASSGYPSLDDGGFKENMSQKKHGGSWTTGGKLAAGGFGAAAMGAAYVGGIVLGDHIYDHGLDATADAVGDGLEDAGEEVAEFAVDAGEFVVDAAEDVGDFVMDLF